MAGIKASVLVPLVRMDEQIHVLFEVRNKLMNRQPGDISFPGGKCEKGERPIETARRETHEELRIPLESIDILGPLDYLVSPIGVRLHAFLGYIPYADYQPNEEEVDHVFLVPLAELLPMTPREAIMEAGTRPIRNFPRDILPQYDMSWRVRTTYPVYFYTYKEKHIWGLTARVLKNFLDIYKGIV